MLLIHLAVLPIMSYVLPFQTLCPMPMRIVLSSYCCYYYTLLDNIHPLPQCCCTEFMIVDGMSAAIPNATHAEGQRVIDGHSVAGQ